MHQMHGISEQDRSLLNIDRWADDVIAGLPVAGGRLALRLLRAVDIPLDVISCADNIDVPPGTRHQDVAYLLIEQLLELAGRRSDTVDQWRQTRGATSLMGRLRVRLRVELESLRMAQAKAFDRDIGASNLRADAFMAERRLNSGIPREARTLTWRVRKLWYGEWSV